jgi:hypothetical protein
MNFGFYTNSKINNRWDTKSLINVNITFFYKWNNTKDFFFFFWQFIENASVYYFFLAFFSKCQ